MVGVGGSWLELVGVGCLKVAYICSLLLLLYKNSKVGLSWWELVRVGGSWLESVGVGCHKITCICLVCQSWWELVGVGGSWLP